MTGKLILLLHLLINLASVSGLSVVYERVDEKTAAAGSKLRRTKLDQTMKSSLDRSVTMKSMRSGRGNLCL